jgi:hypothetical protein
LFSKKKVIIIKNMDNQPKTSFIPKKPIQMVNSSAPLISPKAKKRTLFSFLTTIIFLASLGALGGVYFWKFTLQKKIETQVEYLKQTRDEFDEKFIADATRLNLRLSSALDLLENHLSPSELYSVLEEYTLQTVSFNSFSFRDTKDGKLAISGEGEAKRFETIVLQSDSFGKSNYMRNVLFDNLKQDLEKGIIGFKFNATLDPDVVLYKNSLPENLGDNIREN